MKKLVKLIVAVFLAAIIYGGSVPTLFDYGIVVEAQKKCDGSKLAQIPFALNRKSVYSIAPQTIAVISDLSLKEVKRRKKPQRGDTRDFELKYKLYGQLACGKEPKFVASFGKDTTELPVVEYAWKDPQHLDIVGDETEEEAFLPSLMVEFTANDLPQDPKLNGLACLIERADFLKVDPETLAQQMCGKGNPANILKKTSNSISVVVKSLSSKQGK